MSALPEHNRLADDLNRREYGGPQVLGYDNGDDDQALHKVIVVGEMDDQEAVSIAF